MYSAQAQLAVRYSRSAKNSIIIRARVHPRDTRHDVGLNIGLDLTCGHNGVRRCTNSRQVALERTEPLPRRKWALDIPDGTSFTALLTSFDLLKGNFRPKRVGNVAQRQRRIRIVDSTAASGRASG